MSRDKRGMKMRYWLILIATDAGVVPGPDGRGGEARDGEEENKGNVIRHVIAGTTYLPGLLYEL